MHYTTDFNLQLQPLLHFPRLQNLSSKYTMDLLVTLSALLLALGTACVHVNGPATAVPISESFLYTTPAMYLWVSFTTNQDLTRMDD